MTFFPSTISVIAAYLELLNTCIIQSFSNDRVYFTEVKSNLLIYVSKTNQMTYAKVKNSHKLCAYAK